MSKTLVFRALPALALIRFMAPADSAGGAAPAGDAPPSTPPAGDAPAGKWFEAADFAPEDRAWLDAKGLTKVDDPFKAVIVAAKGHRHAEQRLGKGIDSIMDRPANGQPLPEWLKANAKTLGLPEAEDGYAVAKPEDWPEGLPWSDDLETKARKLAFEMGVPPDQHKAYVNLWAKEAAAWAAAADEGLARARGEMMAELNREWGDQTEAKLTLGKQGVSWLAQQAGLGEDAVGAVMQLLSEKTGDASVAKMFAALGTALGEDSLAGVGKGGGLAMSPQEAAAELSRFTSPDGEYAKAFAAQDVAKLRELRPRFEMLAKAASAG